VTLVSWLSQSLQVNAGKCLKLDATDTDFKFLYIRKLCGDTARRQSAEPAGYKWYTY
jgi:hypothetical protein